MQMTAKQELRQRLRRERRAFPNELRLEFSEEIAKRLLASRQYRECEVLLVFVSTRVEVETDLIIRTALADGKTVGTPKCESVGNIMHFYRINGMDDLESGAFGISEPKLSCPKIEDFSQALCILPGLAFSQDGHRIGFGRGFYDRFLSGYSGSTCGICFDEFLLEEIPTEDCDIAADMIVTQSKTVSVK
jgi:5-formyltetrahydrofolate cyclo-ligase